MNPSRPGEPDSDVPGDPGLLRQGWQLQQQGRLDEAEAIFREVLSANPANPSALHFLGVLEAGRRNFPVAARLIEHAIEIDPQDPFPHYNLGNILSELGRYEDALNSYTRSLALEARNAGAHNNCGAVLFALNRFEEAVLAHDRAIALDPQNARAHNNRGNALLALGRNSEALASFDRALSLNPMQVSAIFGRGKALMALWRREEALSAFDCVIAIEPDDTQAHFIRADILFQLRQYERALAACDSAIATQPGFANAHEKRGDALFMLGRGAESAAAYDRAFCADPDLEGIEGARLLANLYICDWSNVESERSRLEMHVLEGKRAAKPFAFLMVGTSPQAQLACARSFVAAKYPSSSTPMWRGEIYRHAKLRIGYTSGEFRDQATGFLVADLFECHDRDAFELHGFSTGFDDKGAMRRRIRQSFDSFSEVFGMSDREIAERIRSAEIDVLVDLNGFFGEARTGVFALRPSPIQVNYLGFPGTMGADCMDYIFADRLVVPEADQKFYAEKVIYLPDTYQANDRKKVIGQSRPRTAYGLPDHGMVFCSFNNPYKITPEVFDIWMRLIRETENSVLWLLELDSAAKRNLMNEASARGVMTERIIFAPFLRLADHLARVRLADLFLDTLPVNAHTTASDALWTGVPVLTCYGSTFAGRVAASLLAAVGLQALITRSTEEYESLALKLAQDPDLLRRIKAKLASNRSTHALFDTPRLARHIESAYQVIIDRHRKGLPAEAFSVEPLTI